ncbi:MAG: DUF4382 domain-containing protein [Bacteroidota bacterium]
MTSLSTYKTLFFLLSLFFLATSCSKEESTLEQGSIVSVKINGASEDLNQIILNIEEVQLLIGSTNDVANWVSLETINTGLQNISNYNHENQLTLVNSALIEAGKVQKIKLVLGDDNAAIVNGVKKTFENYSEALEISNLVPTTLDANKGYEFTMEIEADNSISISGNEITFTPEMNTMMRHLNIR